MRAVLGPHLLRPRSDEDVHVGSGIQFTSLAGCNHLFGVHDPYGIHNTWLSLSSLGLPSSETPTLKKFSCCVSRRTYDTEVVKGVNFWGGYRCCNSG